MAILEGLELILEMASTPEMIQTAIDIKPNLVTLVPEKRKELTTEGGLDLISHQDEISKSIQSLQEKGIPVSIFIDPDVEQIRIAQKVHADMIEIHTGAFCDAETADAKDHAFSQIVRAAKLAKDLKLGVNAGHGLCYTTIKAFKGLSEIDEFSIGHSIISRAVLVGMERAVREMKALIDTL